MGVDPLQLYNFMMADVGRRAGNIASIGHAFAPLANSTEGADNALRNAQGMVAAASANENARREHEARKKAEEEEGGVFGPLLGAAGNVAGVALAPVTGGASIPVGAALGAAGNAAGQAIDGGKFNADQVALSGASGAAGVAGANLAAGGLVSGASEAAAASPVAAGEIAETLAVEANRGVGQGPGFYAGQTGATAAEKAAKEKALALGLPYPY